MTVVTGLRTKKEFSEIIKEFQKRFMPNMIVNPSLEISFSRDITETKHKNLKLEDSLRKLRSHTIN